MIKQLLIRILPILLVAPVLLNGCDRAKPSDRKLSQEHFAGAFDKLTVDSVDGKAILRFEKHVTQKNGKTIKIRSSYPANELLVRLKTGVSKSQFRNFLDKSRSAGSSLNIIDSLASDSIYLIRIDTAGITRTKAFVDRLMRTGLFKYAEPDYLLNHSSNQFPYILDTGQWSFFNHGLEHNQFGGKFDADIDAIEAIARLKDGEIPMQPVTVAIIDGGIDIFHYALKNRLWKNPEENPNNNTDDDGEWVYRRSVRLEF